MPYPEYDEIFDPHKKRTRQEQEAGRQRTLKSMAEGLIERLRIDHGLKELDVHLDTSNSDPRLWAVLLTCDDTLHLEENLWEFPSQNLQAQLILLGKVKK